MISRGNRPDAPRRHRRCGQTLIELVVSMTLSTMLMLGLGSCLFIVSSAFDGSTDAVQTSLAAEVQADMMVDLNQATEIAARSADSITFSVPDRNNDGSDESITYAWAGLPAAELHYSLNGSLPVTVLNDVQGFQLSYVDRTMSGDYPPLPPVDSSIWGQRWKTGGIFGFNTIYAYDAHEEKNQFGTFATLSEDGIVQSISAHFRVSQKSPVRYAIYDVDASNNPRNLVVSTAAVEVNSTGWLTIPTAPTSLTAGNYYLTISIQRATKVAFSYTVGGGPVHIVTHDAATKDFKPTWGTSDRVLSVTGSVYATYTSP